MINDHSPAAVLSAYTGVLMCKFEDMHRYIEHVLDRPVFTHELGSVRLVEKIKNAIKENGDFDRAMAALNTLHPSSMRRSEAPDA